MAPYPIRATVIPPVIVYVPPRLFAAMWGSSFASVVTPLSGDQDESGSTPPFMGVSGPATTGYGDRRAVIARKAS
ncbi:hypothetical protein Ahu01nite_053760 [Winogradskya humida]|uniref:Uncharacterized protein n=1 Tax=Winogradskya humida TaxID=113566 RepID=A0ABQ3ZUM5_9ACTN|nr:hypothetical protein Ahu01nite_053760 [Actinoplanes humidus]